MSIIFSQYKVLPTSFRVKHTNPTQIINTKKQSAMWQIIKYWVPGSFLHFNLKGGTLEYVVVAIVSCGEKIKDADDSKLNKSPA